MKKYFNSLRLIVDFKYFTFFYLVLLFVLLTFLEVLSISIIYPFIKFILSGELFFFNDFYYKFGFGEENVVVFLCIFLIFSFVLKKYFFIFFKSQNCRILLEKVNCFKKKNFKFIYFNAL